MIVKRRRLVVVAMVSTMGIDGAMMHDRQRPTTDVATLVEVEPVSAIPDLHEGVLNDFFSSVLVAEDTIGEPERDPTVSVVQRHKGVSVAGCDRPEEFRIRLLIEM